MLLALFQLASGLAAWAAIIWYFGFGNVVAFIAICAFILAGLCLVQAVVFVGSGGR